MWWKFVHEVCFPAAWRVIRAVHACVISNGRISFAVSWRVIGSRRCTWCPCSPRQHHVHHDAMFMMPIPWQAGLAWKLLSTCAGASYLQPCQKIQCLSKKSCIAWSAPPSRASRTGWLGPCASPCVSLFCFGSRFLTAGSSAPGDPVQPCPHANSSRAHFRVN